VRFAHDLTYMLDPSVAGLITNNISEVSKDTAKKRGKNAFVEIANGLKFRRKSSGPAWKKPPGMTGRLRFPLFSPENFALWLI